MSTYVTDYTENNAQWPVMKYFKLKQYLHHITCDQMHIKRI
jgi:hypothetical protein